LTDLDEIRKSKESSLHIELKSSKGNSLTFDTRGSTPWDSVALKLNSLLGYDIRCEEYSFSLVGSNHHSTGRFYMCASHNGRLYHEEFFGSHETSLCVESYLDIVNSIICRNSKAIHD